MNYSSTKRCPRCNKLGIVVNSNNPLSPGICTDCLAELVSWKDLKAVDNWCRTYNIPFNPDKWIRMSKELEDQTFKEYINVIMDEYKSDPNYKEQEDNGELWKKVNSIWHRNLEFEELLTEIESIKDGWLKIQQSKWGPQYEFSEYLRLEEITNSTIRSTGTTNPLTIDTIRKLATTSVMIDRAISQGEVKDAAEYSKMYQAFIKSGGFEEMINVSGSQDVIANIADLCNYLEEKNFNFPFYDGVSRDIVDKTILDQQNWIRKFVVDNAGIIQQEYEIISDAYENKIENDKYQEATSKVTLEELIEQKKRGINEEIDQELENEDFSLEEGDLNEDDYKF